MLKQKPNQYNFEVKIVLGIALFLFSILLGRTLVNLVSSATNQDANGAATVGTSEAFDYTRDRDQYETGYASLAAPFDYTRDRDQYEVRTFVVAAPFDYTRDRDQYETGYASLAAPFDYTRDRDQYWQSK